jgi:hypothetical protein
MDIFVTDGRHQRLVDTDPAVTVSEFLAANGLEGDLYAADRDDQLDAGKSLGSQGITAGAKVIVARCRRVEVTVNFNGAVKVDSFPPGAALAAVFAWATGKKGFDLPRSEAAKHTFEVCGGTEQPDRADHIGSWAGDDCKVCLDLVPKQKFEG